MANGHGNKWPVKSDWRRSRATLKRSSSYVLKRCRLRLSRTQSAFRIRNLPLRERESRASGIEWPCFFFIVFFVFFVIGSIVFKRDRDATSSSGRCAALLCFAFAWDLQTLAIGFIALCAAHKLRATLLRGTAFPLSFQKSNLSRGSNRCLETHCE